MYQTILVPLDGSALAERVVPYARALANAAGSRILLLRAVPAPAAPPGVPTANETRARREAEEYLTEVAARIAGPAIVETAVFEADAADSIVEETRLRKVDLVVMSTHGSSGMRRVVYGSVADRVMRRVDVPVLLIPPGCQVARTLSKTPRIVVPLDGSDLSKEALGPAFDLASALGGEVILAHVIVPPTYTYADVPSYVLYDPSEDRKAARRYLEGVAEGVQAIGVAVSLHDAIGIPASTITAIALETEADLIVMATHGRGGISRLLMGSVATEVIRCASVPVMIVRPAAVRAQLNDTSGSDSIRPVIRIA